MKFIKTNAFKAFIMSFILGALIIIPNIILSGEGIFTVTSDFNLQQIPFNMLINNSIKSGSFLYTWINDLGSNLVGIFSFYNMFSPFNILGYLFPAEWFKYLIGPIFILKYAVAGLTSYLFLSRHVKNKKYAILGSLLYSFSGFQLTNTLFFHFHDAVAFFPLFLYTFERLLYDNKKGWFALTTALVAATNWFFFIQQAIFVVIYYLINILTKTIKFDMKKFLQILFEGIIGTSIVMFILFPTVLSIIGNPRISGEWNLKTMFFYDIFRYADIFKSLFFPAESMTYRTTIYPCDWSSVETFLPFVGIFLVITYIIKKPKNKWSLLLYTLLFMMFIPILNNSFYLFTASFYGRWYYIFTLIASLLSIKVLDEKLYSKHTIKAMLLIFATFLGIAITAYITKGNTLIQHENKLIFRMAVLTICTILTYIISKNKNNNKKYNYLIIGVFIYTIIMGNEMVLEYKKSFKVDREYSESYLNSKKYLKDLDTTSFRADADQLDYMLNIGYINNKIILNNFNSNITNTAHKFYSSVGKKRTLTSLLEKDDDEIRNFLSIKFHISKEKNNTKYEIFSQNDEYIIYENKDVHPMGIVYKYYILESDYKSLNLKRRKYLLDKTLVITKNQEKKYKKVLKKIDMNNIKKYYQTENEFEFLKNGFSSKIKNNEDGVVLYTIPYDTGWNITLNNKKVDYDESANGFIIFPLNSGENEISGNYFPNGLKESLIISVIGLSILGLYVVKKHA